ncbi:hypothetical protein DNH61_04740 [Paenibacillus sambharensis]|uniref:Uncharacterized protein n=1 Tax=Paenibacillus sambharensis TaxID=1803190 RepID=A0A2W1LR82_9BACL|nr:hypothetical protein [Paenibacillus sambharensis]PZD97034.1 hypothetical protein DNH61_04740 [Paenibacillus sambharensis]
MLKGWRFPIAGILIVGAAAAGAPLLGLSDYGRTIPMFILFVLFVGALQLLEWLKDRRRGR